MSMSPTSLAARRLRAVEIPKLMRSRPRDPRGYPIPFIVMMDKSGTPQFTINDHVLVMTCLNKRLCSICGRRINSGFWFVGGSRCFLHEHGAFLDPPLHHDCATYALRVCPFLAARRYTDRIDARLLNQKDLPDGVALVKAEYMPPNLPERFGLGLTQSFRLERRPGDHVMIAGPWDYVEFWKSGERCDAPVSAVPPDPAHTLD